MPAYDREVYAHLTADQGTSIEIDMLTYAIFANERHEWVKHFQQRQGRPPTEAEIDDWTANISDWRFTQMREEAIQFFDTAARNYLEEEIAGIRDEALRSSVIAEVKAAGGFWRQLAMQVITAILAPLIIGLFILAALTYDREAPTAGGIMGKFRSTPAQPAPADAPK
jgi:hypothetical protein